MPSTRTMLLLIAVLLAVVGWRLDAAHRDACIRAGRVDCSWLPTQGSGPGASRAPEVGGAVSGAGSPVPGANGAASGVGGSVSGRLGSGASQVP
jgi:hypothetical protein